MTDTGSGLGVFGALPVHKCSSALPFTLRLPVAGSLRSPCTKGSPIPWSLLVMSLCLQLQSADSPSLLPSSSGPGHWGWVHSVWGSETCCPGLSSPGSGLRPNPVTQQHLVVPTWSLQRWIPYLRSLTCGRDPSCISPEIDYTFLPAFLLEPQTCLACPATQHIRLSLEDLPLSFSLVRTRAQMPAPLSELCDWLLFSLQEPHNPSSSTARSLGPFLDSESVSHEHC